MKERKSLSLFVFLSSLLLVRAPLEGDIILFSHGMSAAEPTALAEADSTSQSGAVAPLDYLLAFRNAEQEFPEAQVRLEQEGLILDSKNTRTDSVSPKFNSISPAFNFNEAGGEAFRVRIEISPEATSASPSGERWAQIHFGGEKPNRFVWASGFGILIRSDPSREEGYQVFYNGESIGSGSVSVSDKYRFDIVVEDGVVAFTINGELQRPFEDDSATYPVDALRLNYVTFGAHNPTEGPMLSVFSSLSLSRLDLVSGSLLILSSVSVR